MLQSSSRQFGLRFFYAAYRAVGLCARLDHLLFAVVQSESSRPADKSIALCFLVVRAALRSRFKFCQQLRLEATARLFELTFSAGQLSYHYVQPLWTK